MRVLVCGGTGVLGRYLVPRLVARGHEVTVLARSDERARLAQGFGARPVTGDILAPNSLHAAAPGHDAIVHAATRIPRTFPGKPEDFAANDRLRREGTAHLLAAAETAGIRRIVLQSIIWVHGDHGVSWIDETATLKPGRLNQSAVDLESQGRDFAERTGATVTALRCGSLYAAESWHTREIVRRLRQRLLPIVAGGHNYQGFIHAADMAAAFTAALEGNGAGGAFFVTDDEPVPLGDYLRWLAHAAAASEPLHLPRFMARLALGQEMEAAYSSSLRCRNDRSKQALGWKPQYPTFRDGYVEVLPKLQAAESG
jgi:nucleoside-diphosphate-sugar epimerase